MAKKLAYSVRTDDGQYLSVQAALQNKYLHISNTC